MVALIAPPAYVGATDQNGYLKLLITGIICVMAAMIGGHFLTIRARVPVPPNIRGPWLGELREDIVNANAGGHPAEQGGRARPMHCRRRAARLGKHPGGGQGHRSPAGLRTSGHDEAPERLRLRGLCCQTARCFLRFRNFLMMRVSPRGMVKISVKRAPIPPTEMPSLS